MRSLGNPPAAQLRVASSASRRSGAAHSSAAQSGRCPPPVDTDTNVYYPPPAPCQAAGRDTCRIGPVYLPATGPGRRARRRWHASSAPNPAAAAPSSITDVGSGTLAKPAERGALGVEGVVDPGASCPRFCPVVLPPFPLWAEKAVGSAGRFLIGRVQGEEPVGGEPGRVSLQADAGPEPRTCR